MEALIRDFYSPVFHHGDGLCRLPSTLFPECRYVYANRFPMLNRRVAIISSRIGRRYTSRGAWLDRLCQVLTSSAQSGHCVINCAGTTCDRFLQHARQSLGFEIATSRLAENRLGYGDWLTHLAASASSDNDQPTCRFSLSPALTRASGEAIGRVPTADRLLAALGEDVIVLHARKGGGIERLIDASLTHDPPWGQRWFLAVGPDLVPAALATRWLNQGAAVWRFTPDGTAEDVGDVSVMTHAIDGSKQLVELCDVEEPDRYLAHWTRCQTGPWPDESQRDFVTGLLLEPKTRDRSAMAALIRIVSMKRLIATNRLTRSEARVVCFTNRPITEFPARRVYRAMHARWDFEPFGLCIDRKWLVRRGVSRVRYGDDAVWNKLDQQDRPYYQFQDAAAMEHGAPDWTQEREWRHVGDLDLSHLPPDKALVFVPSTEDTSRLQQLSPWPIVIIPQAIQLSRTLPRGG